MATSKKVSLPKNSITSKETKNKSSSLRSKKKVKMMDEPEPAGPCVMTSPAPLGVPCLPYFNALGVWTYIVIEANNKYIRFDGQGGLMASNT